MAAITTSEYQAKLFGILDFLATDIISPNSTGSHIEKRYIASEGRDDEMWLGYLRDDAGVVDIWLMTMNMFTGLEEGQSKKGSVGTFTKPVSIIIDYFADYHQGLDFVENVSTNTEREFLKKVMAVDLALEKKKGCLDRDNGDSIMIVSWDFRLKLRRFANATTHWANGLLNLEIVDLRLQ